MDLNWHGAYKRGGNCSATFSHEFSTVASPIRLPAPQVANFLLICLIVRMLSSTYRIDELRSSDGIMHYLLRHARFMCKWNELK